MRRSWRSLAGMAALAPLALAAGAALAQQSPPVSALPQARRPQVCTEDYAPVCGRIGKVDKIYSNKCFARAAGATLVTDGPCHAGPDATTPQ